MKRFIVLAGLWIAVFSPVSAQSQSRFGDCEPGVININIAGTMIQANHQCGFISRVNEAGYYPIGTPVHFEYRKNTFSGVVVGTQWTWKADRSIQVQYDIMYTDDIGVQFMVKEVVVDLDKVTPI